MSGTTWPDDGRDGRALGGLNQRETLGLNATWCPSGLDVMLAILLLRAECDEVTDEAETNAAEVSHR